MRNSQTYDPLIFVNQKMLLRKIERIVASCKSIREYPMTIFKDHVSEVEKEVEARLSDAINASDPTLREQYYLFSLISIELLSHQVEKSLLVKRSIKDPMWAQLNLFVDNLVTRTALKSKPLPFFGSSFYCTGSFTYTEQGIPISPFYQVSTELHQSILFWPLLAHEIAHLKLDETSALKDLRKELSKKNLRDEKYSSHLEETVCDIIATILFGPAYIAAFCTRLWHDLASLPNENYPSTQFRLKMMLNSIEKDNSGPLVSSIFSNIELNDKQVKKEKIFFLAEEMLDLGKSLVQNPANVTDVKIIEYTHNPSLIMRGRMDYLFNVFWLMVLQNNVDFDSATKAIDSTLKGWTKGLEPFTKR